MTWLNSIQNSMMIGMAAGYLYELSEVWPLLENAEVGFVPEGKEIREENLSYRLPVHFVGDRMRDDAVRPVMLKDFREYLLRNTLSETLEHTREYCVATHQEDKLLSADWYHFARVLRNAITHDSVIRFDRLARPPLAFGRWTIEAAHEGKHISQTGVASTATIPLLVAIHRFVDEKLD